MKKLLLLSLFTGIITLAKAQSTDHSLDEARKAIEASNAIFADLASKKDGSILTRYTDDACLYPPNASPVCGGDNIVNFFKGGPQVHSTFTIQHLYGDGKTFVTEESFYEMTDLAGKQIDKGRVIVIWKKTKEGWKMYRDMFSSDLPAK